MSLHKYSLLALLFLVGCAVRTPVGPTHMSDKVYYCRGSWHYPQDYYEYDEIGLASWYGDAFHGKAKASGEKFDKFAMTAAHKTLPIPSVVRVESFKTGKSVIVVVDDRGPFCYRGRIIDLSYGAACALGIHKMKPSDVRVTTLVSESLKLSRYIYYNCKGRRDPFGRSWAQLYFQEIRGSGMHIYTKPEGEAARITKTTQNAQRTSKKQYNGLGSYLNKI
ncbi:MAG: septal ring lytic transglycosylase RlpA family protein [Alphaproteobacteria bacterium]|nr:septal ring lytic transglycosylase RlpA family protein [Alphaproteobacteria bacterium]